MNESREYRLDQAILLYRHSKVGRHPLVAATVHPVEFKDSVPVIQPGRPLDLAALKHLAEHFDTPSSSPKESSPSDRGSWSGASPAAGIRCAGKPETTSSTNTTKSRSTCRRCFS